MEYIKGVTFGYLSKKGDWEKEEARQSILKLIERCNANYIILPIVVEQARAQSTEINWKSDSVLSDYEVKKMIQFIHEKGLKVILKPMVNVSDGTWRAHINFFDVEVPCEPNWSDWFDSYNRFILHYAKIAQETKCEMFVIGCEMVNADRRVEEWKKLIELVRMQYNGSVTYNCDKYQENHLKWWDAVDIISSSGYYPIEQWDNQLNRIEKVVREKQKPFFFCEVGCPSRKGSEMLPNNWELKGEISQKSQADWFEKMFAKTGKRDWVGGYGVWDWKASLYDIEFASEDSDYSIYGKKAEKVISKYYADR